MIEGVTPWIIDELEDKIQLALGMKQLTYLHISNLRCKKSFVANEFLDMMCGFDIPDNGLDKLIFSDFFQRGPFEDEVLTRVANMCPCISYLHLSMMTRLSEVNRLSMVKLFRQIIQQSPPIQVLNMASFSDDADSEENLGELVLEALLNTNINSITTLNLSSNISWFKQPETG